MRIEYFQGKGRRDPSGAHRIEGQWYWRLVAGNGRTIADGAEGYSRKGNVLRACEKMESVLALDKNGQNVQIVEAAQ